MNKLCFSGGSPRGPVSLAWFSFAFLNTGILITALQFWLPNTLFIGRIAEVCATILFVVGSRRRVKPQGML